jgi:cytochrome c oxidase subunit 2
LSGCDVFSSPQNTFAPAGEIAEDQKQAFMLAMWPALAVFLFVQLGVIYIVVRYRRRKSDTQLPKQVHGNNALEIGWTIAPALVLLAFVPLVVGGIFKFGRIPDDAIMIDVYGVQWQWNYGYPTTDGASIDGPFGDPMYIPVDQNVGLRLHSDNVIHSFWVPKLAGKTDVMPGHTNEMWFNAHEVGTFQGQCAEFCGIGHANMPIVVEVVTRETYDRYVGCLGEPDGAGCDEFLPESVTAAGE